MSSDDIYRSGRSLRGNSDNREAHVRDYLLNSQSSTSQSQDSTSATRYARRHPKHPSNTQQSSASAPLTHAAASELLAQQHQSNSASLDKTLGRLADAQGLSASSLSSLQQQSEQLKRIDNELNSTSNALGKSERVLHGMESITGSIGNWWRGAPKEKDYTFDADAERRAIGEEDARRRREKEEAEKQSKKSGGMFSWLWGGGSEVTDEDKSRATQNEKKSSQSGARQTSAGASRKTSGAGTKGVGGGGKRIDDDPYADFRDDNKSKKTNAKKTSTWHETDETSVASESELLKWSSEQRRQEDAKLDDISTMLAHLKDDATNINKELSVQSKHLDHISARADHTKESIKKQSKRIDKL
jgi:hypothetical protein